MSADLATVRLIAEAQAKGATWAQIAPAIGCATAKEAKVKAHRLARGAQRDVIASRAIVAEAGDE